MSILEKIAARTRERVEDEKRARPLADVRRAAEERAAAERAAGGPAVGVSAGDVEGGASAVPFERALARPGVSFICEVKRASPSQGLIARDFPYVDIARDYEAAGAAAVSCLTEPFWFQGRDEYLVEIARAVDVPVLRKDFVVDEYMVYGAKALGAQAVLLICAILDDGQLAAYRALCDELGLSALVEAHTEREVERALAAGARVVGVNNRDLATFEVDLGTSGRLRALAPSSVLFVSESGIRTADDVERLRAMGTDAVLVGETLMRAPDKRAALDELRGEGA